MNPEPILHEVKPIRTMSAALRWAQSRTPRAVFVNVVTQDEFTSDVIVRAGASVFVVFDTT